MWYAGTNFGRTSMYLQTTRYGFGAPLDEYGRLTPCARFLKELHLILRQHEGLILGGKCIRLGDRTTWRLGQEPLTLDLGEHDAVLRDGDGRILFDTGAARDKNLQAASVGWHNLPILENWEDLA